MATLSANDVALLANLAERGRNDSVARFMRGIAAGDMEIFGGVRPDEVATLDLSRRFVLYEDFFGTWSIAKAGPQDLFSTTAGAGTATQVATTVAASLNGEVTLKSATDNGTNAQNCSMLTGINLGWKANSGGLAFEARVKLDVITNAYLFVGFTDTISTTVECPIFMTAADVDSDATNACGIVFDTNATVDRFTLGGVKADVDTVPLIAPVAPVANVYVTLRVEVSPAGAVEGFIDGRSIGTLANAVTVTTPLTPAIVVGNRSAAQRIVTIDYLKAEQNRVG